MIFGVNSWVWVSPLTTDRVAELAPHVAAMGYDLLQLPIEGMADFDYHLAGQLVADAGLQVGLCAVIGSDRDLIHPDAAIRENGLAYMRHCIDAAEIVGSADIVGPIYAAVGRVWQSTQAQRQRDLDRLVDSLRMLADYAGDRGVVLGLEPLNRFETSFINLAAQAIEVIDRVDHPACQIMLDTFHMNIEEKSLGDAIRATGPRLCHVHACENDRGTPGTGNVDWNEMATALHDINYAGPVVIESFTSEVQSIARAAAIWRPLAPSQDELAADGLAFLRKLLG